MIKIKFILLTVVQIQLQGGFLKALNNFKALKLLKNKSLFKILKHSFLHIIFFTNSKYTK